MSDIITFRVWTVDIYIWSIIVRIVHICSCIISIPILGVITLYRVCSYLLILLLPLWGTDSVHLGMVFFCVRSTHSSNFIITIHRAYIYIYMSGIITTLRVYSFRYHNLYRYRWYLESIKPEFFYLEFIFFFINTIFFNISQVSELD